MYTVGPGIWRENRKTWKMRHTQGRICNMARKVTNENVKLTTQELEYGEKSEKPVKCDILTVEYGIWRETVKNEKYTLQDLDYGKKTHKQGKWENHMVGPGTWQDTLKKV